MPIQQISEKSIFALVIDYYYLCNKSCLIREYRCKHREGSVSKSLPLILFSSDYQIYILDSRFCYQKVAPKVSAGHRRRDRTAVLPERARKIYAVCAHPLRALEPPFDLFLPPVQCGGCCALRATMIIRLRPYMAGPRHARSHCFRYFSRCLIFWCFWIKSKAQEKLRKEKLPNRFFGKNFAFSTVHPPPVLLSRFFARRSDGRFA